MLYNSKITLITIHKITLRCLIVEIVILLLIIHFTYFIINYIIKKGSFTTKVKVKQIEHKLQEYGKPTVYQGNIISKVNSADTKSRIFHDGFVVVTNL